MTWCMYIRASSPSSGVADGGDRGGTQAVGIKQ